jgi:hypothetical protein
VSARLVVAFLRVRVLVLLMSPVKRLFAALTALATYRMPKMDPCALSFLFVARRRVCAVMEPVMQKAMHVMTTTHVRLIVAGLRDVSLIRSSMAEDVVMPIPVMVQKRVRLASVHLERHQVVRVKLNAS